MGGTLSPEEGAWETVSSSANPHADGWHTPKSMDRDDLETVKAAFVDSTRRAERIGFDLIELHGAHGYLMHEFLSPIANTRDDEYGGSLENRLRFATEIIAAVRARVGKEFIVGYRMGVEEFIPDGITVDDSKRAATQLAALGSVDYLSLAQGNFKYG